MLMALNRCPFVTSILPPNCRLLDTLSTIFEKIWSKKYSLSSYDFIGYSVNVFYSGFVCDCVFQLCIFILSIGLKYNHMISSAVWNK